MIVTVSRSSVRQASCPSIMASSGGGPSIRPQLLANRRRVDRQAETRRPFRALDATSAAAACASGVDLGASRRQGDLYLVSEEEKETFQRDGYVKLRGVLSPEELRGLEATYEQFLKGELVDPKVLGKDFCDMSGGYDRPLSDFNIINIMLPTRYYPKLKGNIYERRSASIAEQLCGSNMAIDYDQLLAKPPNKPGAVFHWHQDLSYWPVTKDTRTASFWLAIDDVDEENGCIRFVPGSHKEPKLRESRPLHGDRSKSHTLVADIKEGDLIVPACLSKGDLTVHHERVVHGSGGNLTMNRWRRAYVLAYRARETVEEERRMGFTHSHNDALDVLNSVGKEEE